MIFSDLVGGFSDDIFCVCPQEKPYRCICTESRIEECSCPKCNCKQLTKEERERIRKDRPQYAPV
jgi:hypothetical protein